MKIWIPFQSTLIFLIILLSGVNSQCTTPYSQGLCPPTSSFSDFDSLLNNQAASWCQSQHPSLQPLLFNATYINDHSSSILCNGTSPGSPCRGVLAITVIEVGDSTAGDEFIEGNTIQSDSIKVLAVSTVNQILLLDFNTQTILASIDRPLSATVNSSNLAVNSTLYKHHVNLESGVDGNNFWLIETIQNHLTAYTITTDGSTISIQSCLDLTLSGNVIMLDSVSQPKWGNEFLLGVLVMDPVTQLYSVQFITLLQCSVYPMIHTWNFDTTLYQPKDMQMQLLVHQGGMDEAYWDSSELQCTWGTLQRVLVVLSDVRYIHIFQYDWEPKVVFFGTGGEFYRAAPTNQLSGAQAFTECYKRIDAMTSQRLYLAVLEKPARSNVTNSTLSIIQYNEFAFVNFNCPVSDSNINPRGWGCNGVPACSDVSHYFNTGNSCIERNRYSNTTVSTSMIHPISVASLQNQHEYLKHIIFLRAENRSLQVWGVQENVCDLSTFNTQLLNEISTFGEIHKFLPTPNAQYVFTTVERSYWVFESRERLQDICDTLEADPDNKILDYYKDACENPPSGPLRFSDFISFGSGCPTGTCCPSFASSDIITTPAGVYTPTPQTVEYCPAGYFCPGIGVKMLCPVGSFCPGTGNEYPIPCPYTPTFSYTCNQEGLSYPQMCPLGYVCETPTTEPVAISEGLFVNFDDRSDYFPCIQGEYCPLGATTIPSSNDTASRELLCPENFYCPSPDVLEPTLCPMESQNDNYTAYCPAGTYQPSKCPAGTMCNTPSNSTACRLGEFCPAGSQIPQLCPEGFYCPEPSTKLICPEGFYCREASYFPVPCSPFGNCPEGSVQQSGSLAGILVGAVVNGCLLIIFLITKKTCNKIHIWKVNKQLQKQEEKAKNPHKNPVQRSTTLRIFPKVEDSGISETIPKVESCVDMPSVDAIDIQFSDISVTLPNGTPILRSVCGVIPHGRFTALMGPSGAGKTTLLNILAGKMEKTSGSILINGKEEDIHAYEKLIGYVPQEDVMLRMLSVQEVLDFNAMMRLPTSMSKSEKKEIVRRVIDVLKLREVSYSLIGDELQRGISGGQRKRVNIGMEIVAEPVILFLDEPTSGLDSSVSTEICKLLKYIAETSGITIVAVLHQPRYEIFKLFHQVILMGKGGRIVYQGPSEETLSYFEQLGFDCPPQTNPADFFIDIVSGKVCRRTYALSDEELQISQGQMGVATGPVTVMELEEIWMQKNNQKVPEKKPSEQLQAIAAIQNQLQSFKRWYRRNITQSEGFRTTPGFWTQTWQFGKRAMIQQGRAFGSVVLDMVMVMLAAGLLGAMYFGRSYIGPKSDLIIEQCPEYLLQICNMPQIDSLVPEALLVNLAVGLTALASSLRVFGPEKAVFWRESRTGMNTLSYFIGKLISQIPQLFTAPFVFLMMFYPLANLNGSFGEYYALLVLLQWAASSIGHVVSILFSTNNSQFAGVVMIIIGAALSGSFPRYANLPSFVQGISSFSYMRWGIEWFYLIEATSWTRYYDIQTGLNYWGWSQVNMALAPVVLFLLGLTFNCISYILLFCMHKNRMQ